jgi:ketosteroid isomerase-like protein
MTGTSTEPQDGRTAPVLRLLAAVGAGDRDTVAALLTDDYVLLEPPSLPWGGEHRGPDGYLAAIGQITDRFTLDFAVRTLAALPDDGLVVLCSDVTFTRRDDPQRAATVPTSEWFTVRAGRIARSEVHLSDTAALLELVES